ncbi:DNA glycosylase/AP lyase ROS1-like [Aristolochia californica]|uniref:DNA glycosylase/AP lyase ROS1-like n=1 Tax=Aristolochia californica TaxID=171875 RepID=UPI0035DCF2D8
MEFSEGGSFRLSGETWTPATPSTSEQQPPMSSALFDGPQSSSSFTQVSPEFYLSSMASVEQQLNNLVAASYRISCSQMLQSVSGAMSSNPLLLWSGVAPQLMDQTLPVAASVESSSSSPPQEPTCPITPVRDTIYCSQSTEQVGCRKESSSLKPRKQRKHRPRVINEGKAKKPKGEKPPKVRQKEKSPKVPKPPKCSIQVNSGEVCERVKRKYTRKMIAEVNNAGASGTTERVSLAEVETAVTHAAGEGGRSSCRRVLKFDLNETVEEKNQDDDFDLNLPPLGQSTCERDSNESLDCLHSNTVNPIPLKPLHFSLIFGENKDSFPRVCKRKRTRVGNKSNRIWFYNSSIRESRHLLVSPCFKTLLLLNPPELKPSRKKGRKCLNKLDEGDFGDPSCLQESQGFFTNGNKKTDEVDQEMNKGTPGDSNSTVEREDLIADLIQKIDETAQSSNLLMISLHNHPSADDNDMKTNPSSLTQVVLHDAGRLTVPEEQMMQRGPEEKEGQIVPFEGMTQIVPYADMFNIRKFKPQVHLDENSIVAWEHRRKIDEGEQTEDLDAELEKKLEGDRQVFKGRMDSFLVRMLQVLGDRRFSQWKGSVLDSIVGVFLTQNVSDHLSSSAFMSLAARFPLQSSSSSKEKTSETEINETTSNSATSYVDDASTKVRTETFIEQDPLSMDTQDPTCSSSVLNSVVSLKRTQNQIWSSTLPNSVLPSQNSPVRGNCLSFLEILQMQGDLAVSVLNGSEIPVLNGKEIVSQGGHMSVRQSVYECSTRQDSGSPDLSRFDLSQVENRLYSSLPVSDFSTALEHGNLSQIRETTQISKHKDNSCADGSDLGSIINAFAQSCNITVQPVLSKEEILNSRQCSLNDEVLLWKIDESNSSQSVKGKLTEPRSKGNGRKEKNEEEEFDWDYLRKEACCKELKSQRNASVMDSLDYEAVRVADVSEVADAIKLRGQHNVLSQKIKEFLNRLISKHGSLDLEWLRHVQPNKAKDYLLSIRGLGLKSAECVRLLALGYHAFPVDTNVARISVRLGWVPLQPMPESVQLHLLEQYPMMDSIQKYLWPRLCKLDKETLYELHYQMITFGKVFCTKRSPKCHVCPMRAECRHFASSCASGKLRLPGTGEKTSSPSTLLPLSASKKDHEELIQSVPLPQLQSASYSHYDDGVTSCEPLIEEPASPAHESTITTDPEVCPDIEDSVYQTNDADEIITINLCDLHEDSMDLQDGEVSNALVTLALEAASNPMPKLKNVKRLRTMHLVYEVPDSHILLNGLEPREPDDPCPYLISIWAPGETAQSAQPPETSCSSQDSGKLCEMETCAACHGVREATAKTVRATLLMPCRTTMRGSFPLNGTYFQVNEVFADHQSSLKPIDVPRAWLWNLPRRLVYVGASISAICRDLALDETCNLFSRAFICVRAFDRKTRYPKPLSMRLRCVQSKVEKTRKGRKKSLEEED